MSSISKQDEKQFFVQDQESELIKKCLDNDRSAQNKLYSLFAKKMMSVCYRYSKNLEDAEDTLNEGFMRVFEKLGSFKGIGSFEGWIRKVMVNVALEKFRKKNIQFSEFNLNDAHDSVQMDTQEDVLSKLNAKELLNLVQKLPPVYQMVFNLYVFEGLKHKEIADMLGISEGTSKSNLSDAREWLKKGIDTLYVEKKTASK
ncbi:MAG TPA: sigma-70 family RNA polymerase sigma factor [Bacteroidia bacterium]|jgi:RNA polymerase sigma-70 factor (ECF subfamily)|nr:sigma-70 family RNA polymerase sigma factor [Bacteroidia bacterium]